MFLKHKGVRVYHIYKNDDMAQGRRVYWYGTSVFASDCSDEHGEFDVRALPAWNGLSKKLGEEKAIRATIIDAIDKGVLKNED